MNVHQENMSILWEDKTHRIISQIDDYPSEIPTNDGGCPVLRIQYFANSATIDAVYGTGVHTTDPMHETLVGNIAILRKLVEENGVFEGVEAFTEVIEKRPNGEAMVYGPNNATDNIYIAFVDDEFNDHWGCSEPEHVEMEEVIASLEGDVRTVTLQEKMRTDITTVDTSLATGKSKTSHTTMTTYEDVDGIGPLYGEQQVREAVEDLKAEI